MEQLREKRSLLGNHWSRSCGEFCGTRRSDGGVNCRFFRNFSREIELDTEFLSEYAVGC